MSADKSIDYSLWKATKGLKRPKTQAAPIRKDNNEWARSDKEKADVFANQLERTFQPLQRQTSEENVKSHTNITSEVIKQVSLNELKQEFKNLSTKKAPGYDLITGQVLKELPGKAIIKLLYYIS